ncbi:hypothetical protein PGT21_016059 [Puccinia graminis f. sp. tritici]|uniref:Uncharacterized protein n=1 Tax=Puccinia graminis f. sp. tritici TaxID=56615 RepID=A0A5B0PRC3_PUCGR|nr:hypothetical protein PGT21_016059 [Puccinia graminis f. sp. tritici]
MFPVPPPTIQHSWLLMMPLDLSSFPIPDIFALYDRILKLIASSEKNLKHTFLDHHQQGRMSGNNTLPGFSSIGTVVSLGMAAAVARPLQQCPDSTLGIVLDLLSLGPTSQPTTVLIATWLYSERRRSEGAESAWMVWDLYLNHSKLISILTENDCGQHLSSDSILDRDLLFMLLAAMDFGRIVGSYRHSLSIDPSPLPVIVIVFNSQLLLPAPLDSVLKQRKFAIQFIAHLCLHIGDWNNMDIVLCQLGLTNAAVFYILDLQFTTHPKPTMSDNLLTVCQHLQSDDEETSSELSAEVTIHHLSFQPVNHRQPASKAHQ